MVAVIHKIVHGWRDLPAKVLYSLEVIRIETFMVLSSYLCLEPSSIGRLRRAPVVVYTLPNVDSDIETANTVTVMHIFRFSTDRHTG
jgi:hypothetical protein